MAIRTTSLGGTDWGAERILAEDLNDTLGELKSRVDTLTCFWLNSDLYTVYDDFESYGTGAFASNSDWTVATADSGGSSSVTVASSTNAGGTSQELVLTAVGAFAGGSTASVETLNASANSHKTCKMKLVTTGGGNAGATHTVKLTLNSIDYTLASYNANDNMNITAYPSFYIIAKGSNVYDIYSSNTKIASDVTSADPNFKITLTTGNNSDNCKLYIDDVVESVGTV